MGGFVGRFGAEDAPLVRRMGRVLDARGPAARWEAFGAGCGLVVVGSGVSSPGSPVGEAEGVRVAVDGHLPHLRALAAELELPDTAGPGEVLAVLVARTGFERAVARLPGDVALAAWIVAERRGWLARDRAGLRSLVWAPAGEGLVFATEARALALGGFVGAPTAAALAELVTLGAVVPPRALRRGANTLEPGGVVSWRAGVVDTRPGPRPRVHPAGSGGNFDRWARSARYGLDLAYSTAARAGTPHAVALSGGLASAALLHFRPRDAGPEVALTLRARDGVEPGAAEMAGGAGLRLVEVPFSAAIFAELAEEVAPHPAWARPETWAWAALAQAAWRAGMVGLASGIGARHGFDPPMPERLGGLGSRLRARFRNEAAPAERLAREYGAYTAGDALDLPLPQPEPSLNGTDAYRWLSRQVALPEVELAAMDAGCASFGLEAIVPFASPAVLAVAEEIPVGVLHHRGRRGLLAAVAGRDTSAAPLLPAPWSLPLAELLSSFELDSLAGRTNGLLAAEHVLAVVSGARAGDPALQRRAFALEMIARGLVG